MDRRGDDLFGGQFRHEITAGDDVRDGVERTDLVEMHEVDLAPVCAPFGGGDAGVDGAGIVRDGVREVQAADETHDVRERAVLVVVCSFIRLFVYSFIR